MKRVKYPTTEKIIELNLLVLTVINVKKSDQPKVLSKSKIAHTIEQCKELKGDVYSKAVCLLKGIIQKHPFASGNRRTAFIIAKYFLYMNGAKIAVKDSIDEAKVMIGIREKFYKDEEIIGWLKNGKIRKFER